MKKRVFIGLGCVAVFVVVFFVWMWFDFCAMQNAVLEWIINDHRLNEGFIWASNNIPAGETILAWWDYAIGIEKISNKNTVIKAASRSIKSTIAGMYKYPWSWIEYELWYPFESEEKVRNVAEFFIAEDIQQALEIADKYGFEYVLVVYPDDIIKFYAIVKASGRNPQDYITSTPDTELMKNVENRSIIRKETIGIKLIYGDNVEHFEKLFDNGRLRIYKLLR